jgi:hypothetical protein
MAAIAAVAVGVIAMDQLGIALPQCLAVGIGRQPERVEVAAILAR